jgi:hypothetical protein
VERGNNDINKAISDLKQGLTQIVCAGSKFKVKGTRAAESTKMTLRNEDFFLSNKNTSKFAASETIYLCFLTLIQREEQILMILLFAVLIVAEKNAHYCREYLKTERSEERMRVLESNKEH